MKRRLVPISLAIAAALVVGIGVSFGAFGSFSSRHNAVDGKLMVEVPAGSFTMGTSPSEASTVARGFGMSPANLLSDGPTASVTLESFFIDQTPVTNAEYKRFLDAHLDRPAPSMPGDLGRSLSWDATSRTFPPGRDTDPVVLVTWSDATAYCAWVGGRLPTEAEWEKAARGPDGRIWPWGNDWDASKANTAELGKGDETPVGQFPAGASPYGALDMVGEVWQWTSSLDRPYPYVGSDGREDPNGVGMRIVRGGAWLFGGAVSRASSRNRFEPSDVSLTIGFRCAG